MYEVSVRANRDERLVDRRLFKALVVVSFTCLLPLDVRLLMLPKLPVASATSALVNLAAIVLAHWGRASLRSFPGVGQSRTVVVTAAAAHLVGLVAVMALRLPYDRPVLVAGAIIHLACLLAFERRRERRAVPLVGVVPGGRVDQLQPTGRAHYRLLDTPDITACIDCQVIVADLGADLDGEWQLFLAEAALQGRLVYHYKMLQETLTGRVEIEHLSENHLGMLIPGRVWLDIKSALDRLAALAMLPLALPLMALIAIAIRLDDGGRALFRQSRVGYGGRAFTLWKFRTMAEREGADSRLDAQTQDDDARITRVGRWLRRNRLDELPQLVNVLRGEMSFIGPRPEPQVLVDWYLGEIRFYRYRHIVRPGISGWAQVEQGHVNGVENAIAKLQYDFYYIKNFSPWLDLVIAWRTIVTVLSGAKAR